MNEEFKVGEEPSSDARADQLQSITSSSYRLRADKLRPDRISVASSKNQKINKELKRDQEVNSRQNAIDYAQQQMNRKELERYIEEGKRPVYGFPHLCFDEQMLLHDQNDDKHIMFWKIIHKSILKKQFINKKGKSEVEQILKAHYDNLAQDKYFLDCLRTGSKINKLETQNSESASENGEEEALSPMTKYLAKHNSSLAKPKDQARVRGILKQVDSQKNIIFKPTTKHQTTALPHKQLKKVKSDGLGAKQKPCRAQTEQADNSRGKAKMHHPHTPKEAKSPPDPEKKLRTPDRFVAKNNYAKQNVRRVREIFNLQNMLKEGKNKIVTQNVLYNNEYIEKRRQMSRQEKHQNNIHVHINDIKELKRSYQTSALTQILTGEQYVGRSEGKGRAHTADNSRTESNARPAQKASQPILEDPYSMMDQEKYKETWSAKKRSTISDQNNTITNTFHSQAQSQERIRPLTSIGSIHIPGLIRNHKSKSIMRGSSCGSIAATGTGDEPELTNNQNSFRNQKYFESQRVSEGHYRDPLKINKHKTKTDRIFTAQRQRPFPIAGNGALVSSDNPLNMAHSQSHSRIPSQAKIGAESITLSNQYGDMVSETELKQARLRREIFSEKENRIMRKGESHKVLNQRYSSSPSAATRGPFDANNYLIQSLPVTQGQDGYGGQKKKANTHNNTYKRLHQSQTQLSQTVGGADESSNLSTLLLSKLKPQMLSSQPDWYNSTGRDKKKVLFY